MSDLYARWAARVPGTAMAEPIALMWLEGPDAAHFLNGLLTNDVAGMTPGDARRCLLLDAKGRIQADLCVHHDGDGAFTLVLAPDQATTVAETFERMHFSEDVEILGPESAASAIVVAGGDHPDADVILPGVVDGTVRVVGDQAVARLQTHIADNDASRAAYTALRIVEAVALFGPEGDDRTLVQELGLEGSAVSFTKGCYLGQETVARAQHRGAVRRGLRVLRAADPLTRGAVVSRDERPVGVVGSTASHPLLGEIALAVVRTDVSVGESVQAGQVAAQIHPAPLPPTP